MLATGSQLIDAQRAFVRAARRRRRAEIARRLRRVPAACARLEVYDRPAAGRAVGLREIPIDAIGGTLEPSRADLFDRDFHPARAAQGRWQRLWLAEQRGAPLPPISVVQVGNAYAVADGHHRVSVARARGAATIDATVLAGRGA